MSVTVGKMARYCPTAGNGPTDYPKGSLQPYPGGGDGPLTRS